MLKIYLRKNEEIEKLNGYPWIFSNEIDRFVGEFESGKVCEVYTSLNEFLCYGFFNSSSKIMVRILSFDKNEKIDKEFFKRRIEYAIEHRKNLGWSATRLVF